MPNLPFDLYDIEDPRFWSRFNKDVYGATARTLLSIFLAGGKSGMMQLPKKAQALLNWDVFNQNAIDYLNLYRLNTVAGINEVTQNQAVKAIGDWIKSGERLDMLTARLEPIFGAERAERIGVTEVTRTYASGNISAWKATGLVTAKVWRTGNDELVCDICGPLNGKTVEIDQNFMLDQNELPPELARQFGEDFIYFSPPAHPRCRCYLAPVTSEVALREKIRGILNED